MDTAQRNIMFQVQFWGLIGPLIALFTLLVIFIKSPSSAIELSFITIIGLLAAWKWKMRGFAVSLGTTFLLYLYQLSTIENDEYLWLIGMDISIVMGCMIAALSYREVEQLLFSQDVKGDVDAKVAPIDFSEVKRLENNILALEHDVAAKNKQLHSYEELVDHVKIEMVKTNQQHEKLLDEFFQKQNQLSLVQEQLNDASNHIKILSEKSNAEIKVDENLQKELSTKIKQISSLEKVIEDLQIQLQSSSNTSIKPCQHDAEIQELKSTNELLARERGRLETCLFRTQIDLHQKTQDLANFPTLQSDFENLQTKNNLLNQALEQASSKHQELENRLYEKELALEKALANSVKDSEMSLQALEDEKRNLKETLQALENNLQSECIKNEALKATISEYEFELENKLIEFKDLEKEANDLKQALKELENNLRNDLKSECEKNEELKATVAQKENALNNKLVEFKELENEVQNSKEALHRLENDLKSESEKNEELKAIIAKKDNELQIRLDSFQGKEIENQNLKHALQTLENDLKAEYQKNEALNAVVAEKENALEIKLDSFKDLENETQNLKQALQTLENDLMSEYEKNEALNAVVAEKENALQNKLNLNYDLENKLQNLNQSLQKLENDLKSECQKSEALKEAVAEKEHALMIKFESSKVLETEAENLKQAFQVIENDLRNDLNSECQKNEALKAVVAEKEERLENTFKSFKELENETQNLKQAFQVIENDLRNNLKSECQKNEVLKNSLEEALATLKENQNTNPESILETSEFKELHFNYKKVEGKYNQLKEQFEQKSEVLNETRRQLFRAEEKVMQLKLDYDEESLYQLNESDASMEQHILNIWNESQDKIQELNEEIKALQSIITNLSK